MGCAKRGRVSPKGLLRSLLRRYVHVGISKIVFRIPTWLLWSLRLVRKCNNFLFEQNAQIVQNSFFRYLYH